jgi:hypothetical protein
MLTSRERIIETLETRPGGLCDDCLSRITDVKPRQQVNMICRDLRKSGKLSRDKMECPEEKNKRKKIVNKLIGVEETSPPIKPTKGSNVQEQAAQYQLASPNAAAKLDYIRRHILAIMNELDPQRQQSSSASTYEGFSDRLRRLSDTRIIPANIMIIMRMLSAMRNAVIYRDCVPEDQEEKLVDNAFNIILGWQGRKGAA